MGLFKTKSLPSAPGFEEPMPVVEYTNQQKACMLVARYILEHNLAHELEVDDVYIVWFTYILGSWKAMISTTLNDGMYYEVTFSRDKQEAYVDAYTKYENVSYKRQDWGF